MTDVCYDILDRKDINLIRPIWDRLRLFTVEMTTHHKRYFRELDFDDNTRKFKKADAKVRFDIARDGKGGPIIGFSACLIDGDNIGEFVHFFVDEAYRNKGVGKTLMKRSLEWFREQGPKDIQIFTAYENDPAVSIYKEFGFYPRAIQLFPK